MLDHEDDQTPARYQYKVYKDLVKAKTRKCLNCDESFLSEHFGHRMCKRCRGLMVPDMADYATLDS